MEHLSDGIPSQFRLKLFLDTNIILYLVNKQYSSLSYMIEFAASSPFLDLVSSQYVLFEFIGLRKLEHFIRERIKQANSGGAPHPNFSSIVKESYEKYDSYQPLQGTVTSSVNSDVDWAESELGIDFQYALMDTAQVSAAIKTCLASALSIQDSLVLVSALFPKQMEDFCEHVIVLTNDDLMARGAKGDEIEQLLSQLGLPTPEVSRIAHVDWLTSNIRNLTEKRQPSVLQREIPRCVASKIAQLNDRFLLGETFTPKNPNFPKNRVCLKLKPDTLTPIDSYFIFLSKSLNYIYSTKTRISGLHHDQEFLTKPTSFSEEKNVSFDIEDPNLDPMALAALTSNDNFVFTHPDNA